MEALIAIRIAEGSGRPVERKLTRAIAPASPVIGIKPNFDGTLSENSEASFNLIALDAVQQKTAMQVKWTINRVERRYQWYQYSGNWEWEPITRRTRVADGDATLGADPVTVTAPVEWGLYEIKVERTGGDYVAASSSFYAGWYGGADASATPDLLEVSLDAESLHARRHRAPAGRAALSGQGAGHGGVEPADRHEGCRGGRGREPDRSAGDR